MQVMPASTKSRTPQLTHAASSVSQTLFPPALQQHRATLLFNTNQAAARTASHWHPQCRLVTANTQELLSTVSCISMHARVHSWPHSTAFLTNISHVPAFLNCYMRARKECMQINNESKERRHYRRPFKAPRRHCKTNRPNLKRERADIDTRGLSFQRGPSISPHHRLHLMAVTHQRRRATVFREANKERNLRRKERKAVSRARR